MTPLQRYVWLRKKGMRHTLAWYVSDMPRKEEALEFVGRFAMVTLIVISVLSLQALMDGRI